MYEIKVKEHAKKSGKKERKKGQRKIVNPIIYLNSKLLLMILLIDNFGWSFCS